jgi:beta-carotene 15,15'-dioxygenase
MWMYFFVLMMVLFGVMHWVGDLDHLSDIAPWHSRSRLIFSYSVIMIVVVLWRLTVPLLTTLAFIVVAAFHFWEEHWEKYTVNRLLWLYSSLWGGVVIGSILFYNKEMVLELLVPLLGDISLFVVYFGRLLALVALAYLFLSFYTMYQIDEMQYTAFFYEFFLLGLIVLISMVWDLYRSFWFYFGVVHSIPKMISNSVTWWKFWWRSWISFSAVFIREYLSFLWSHRAIILATLCLYCVRYLLASSFYPTISSLLIFFMFLGLVTFPHVLLEKI